MPSTQLVDRRAHAAADWVAGNTPIARLGKSTSGFAV
jgi:hypothetical protein